MKLLDPLSDHTLVLCVWSFSSCTTVPGLMQWEYTGLENERIDNLRRDNPPVDWQDQCKHNSEQKQWYNAETCIQCILSIEQQLAWILSRGIKWEYSVQPVVALAGAMALVTSVNGFIAVWEFECQIVESRSSSEINIAALQSHFLCWLCLCVGDTHAHTHRFVFHTDAVRRYTLSHTIFIVSHTLAQ